jgi:hypothetical protein
MPPIFQKVESGIDAVFGGEKHSHAHVGHVCDQLHLEHISNRFHSFAPESSGNIKWFVDGCSYFWAVSEALERTLGYRFYSVQLNLPFHNLDAKKSIYILGWWLSPELYLRRPPSKNAQYRLDTMLKAAAERGVTINIIAYKEVQAALTLDSAVSTTSQSTSTGPRQLTGIHSTQNMPLKPFIQIFTSFDIQIIFQPAMTSSLSLKRPLAILLTLTWPKQLTMPFAPSTVWPMTLSCIGHITRSFSL